MANIARVVAYNSTTRRFYATDTNDTISISQIPLNVTSDNALVNNNGLFVPKINTLTFNGTTNTISINMSDGSSKSVVISSITPDKFLQASSYNTTTKVLSLTMNDNVVIDVDMSDLVKIDVTDSPSIDLSGDGTSANPITASLKLDPSPSNTATITSNGLLVTGGSASLTNSVQPSNATIENGTVPTTILGSLAFLLGAPAGWVEIAGGKKIPYWTDVNNNPVSPYMLFRASDYNGTPTLDYYGNPVTTSWNASSGDFTGTGNAVIQIAPTDISDVNSTNLTFEMWYQDVIPDIDIPNLFSIVNGEVFIPTYTYGAFTTVNTTNGINHFAVSYTNNGRYAVYLNGSLLVYSPIAAAGILSSVSIKSPNVIEASLVINAGILYPASTAVNSITPTNMPLPPVVTVTSTTTTPAPTTTTMPPYPVWVTPETFTVNSTDSSITFNATNATSYMFVSGTWPGSVVMNANGVMGNGTTDTFTVSSTPYSFTLRAFTDAVNYPSISTDRTFSVTVIAPCITGQVFKLSEITPTLPAEYNVIGSITPTANAYTFDSASIEGIMPVKSCNRNLTFRLAWEGTTLPSMAVGAVPAFNNGYYLCGISNFTGQMKLYYGFRTNSSWLTGLSGVALSPVAGRNELVIEYSEDGSNSFFSYWLNGVRLDRVSTVVNYFEPSAWTTQIGTYDGEGSTFTGTIYCADLTTEALYGDVTTIPSFSI